MKYNYYGFKGDHAWHLVSASSPLATRWFQPRLFEQSELVYCQGPRGGVRIVHTHIAGQYGYIRQNSKAMKEFAWIKLKARTVGQTA